MPSVDTGSRRKRWKTVDIDEPAAVRLAGEVDIPLLAARLLVGRGLAAADAATRFLNPRLADLSDPFLMRGMDPAVRRLWDAISGREKIVVFGDYDVDGLTAASMLWKVIEGLGGQAIPFIPNRLDDGYGLTPVAVRRCLEMHRPGLVVTTDCGTGAVDSIREIQASGCDVIVTDHHEPSGRDAHALAEINPKHDSDVRIRNLAGVGVAFKLAHGLVKMGLARKEAAASAIDLRKWLDLVAIGTIGDMVPMTGENRILASHGLGRILESGHPGLRALVTKAKLKTIESYHVGFVLAPRLNAAGRLGDAEKALELLTTQDSVVAERLAQELEGLNAERKEIEDQILQQATTMAESLPADERRLAIVVGGDGWHAGVLGIVAARLSGRFCCPALVASFDGHGMGKGSGRAGEAVDLMQLLGASGDTLLSFGGHRAAAGFVVERVRFGDFKERFLSAARLHLAGVDMTPVLRVDAWVDSLGDLDDQTMDLMKRMEPFGLDNPAPQLGVRGVRVVGTPRVLGGKHLQMSVAAGGSQLDAIAFGMGDIEIPEGPIDIVFRPGIDTYHGYRRTRLQVKDLCESADRF